MSLKMGKTRKSIPQNIEAEIIFLSDFKCCVCQNNQRGHHIHHIDENPGNNALDNLVLLCFECHDEASKKNSLSKKLSARAIMKFKENWYTQIKARRDKHINSLNSPVKQISEEVLLKAALNANMMLDILKIKTKFGNSDDWEERSNLLSELTMYAEYSDYRIAYEVFLFLQDVACYTRANMPYKIASNVFSNILNYYSRNDDDSQKELILARKVSQIADNIIYDAAIYLNNMKILAEGCTILKYIYRQANYKKQKEIKEEVLMVYSSIMSDLESRSYDYKIPLEVLEFFKADLENNFLGIPPNIPSHLRKLVV